MKTLNTIFTDWAHESSYQGINERQREYILNGMAQNLTKIVEHYCQSETMNLDLFDEMLNAQYNPDEVLNGWLEDEKHLYKVGSQMSDSYIETEIRWNDYKQII